MPTIIHEHEIKINPYAYEQVKCGNKTFEIRCNDRGYQKGDRVVMRCFDGNCYDASKSPIIATISYVTNFKQQENWCVFGLVDVRGGEYR